MPQSVQRDWNAPENSNPLMILREAHRDVCARRYQLALSKYKWFYCDASIHDSRLWHARNSFCLLGWTSLGKNYPPALQELRAYRNQLLHELRGNIHCERNLIDFLKISRAIADESLSRDLFVELETAGYEHAAKFYPLFESALVATGEYSTCLKYFKPQDSYDRAVAQYRELADSARHFDSDVRILHLAEKKFRYQTSLIVFMLALSDHISEAKAIAYEAQKLMGYDEPITEISAAFQGIPPRYYLDNP